MDKNFNLDHQSNRRREKAREGIIITRYAFGKGYSRWQVKNGWNGAEVDVPESGQSMTLGRWWER